MLEPNNILHRLSEHAHVKTGIIEFLRTCPRTNNTAKPVKPTDDELIAAYAGGTTDAFDALYARYRLRIYNYCFRAMGFDESAAADICQEIWLRVVRAANSYKPNGQFDRWLFSLAHNCLMDRHRQNSAATTDKIEELVAMDDFVARFEHCDNLEAALSKLPPPQRSALLLHYTEGYNLAEIAALQSTSTETIKSRVRYGLNKLRVWMGDEHAR